MSGNPLDMNNGMKLTVLTPPLDSSGPGELSYEYFRYPDFAGRLMSRLMPD